MWRLTRLGVALGAGLSVIPLPIQILLAGFLAFLCKAHIPTAVAATFISNPLTAILIWAAAWKIGSVLLQQPATAMPLADFSLMHFSVEQFNSWLDWLALNGQPLLLGMSILALLLAIFFYALVMIAWRLVISGQWRLRRS